MVENISLTKYQVETLESIADLLESIDYSKEGAEIKFLTLIVNIESLLPKSNIFDYVFKTDITKDKKLELQEIKKQKFEVINSNVELLKSLPNDIEFKWNQVKENYDIIKENEEKYNIEIDDLYDKIKESQDELYGKIDYFEKEKNEIIENLYTQIKENEAKYSSEMEAVYDEIKKIDDELYGKIDVSENEKNNIVNKTYDEIKSIESNIQDIHTQMSEMASENDVLYGEIENIDFEISQIDNYIEESEWKVDLDSHEEVTFNKIKEKLIIEKKFNYGNI
jgi:predicted  nucleic acid-binding Zn-ribbon protein